eukprot:5238833-Amphidinium_carterae.1
MPHGLLLHTLRAQVCQAHLPRLGSCQLKLEWTLSVAGTQPLCFYLTWRRWPSPSEKLILQIQRETATQCVYTIPCVAIDNGSGTEQPESIWESLCIAESLRGRPCLVSGVPEREGWRARAGWQDVDSFVRRYAWESDSESLTEVLAPNTSSGVTRSDL